MQGCSMYLKCEFLVIVGNMIITSSETPSALENGGWKDIILRIKEMIEKYANLPSKIKRWEFDLNN